MVDEKQHTNYLSALHYDGVETADYFLLTKSENKRSYEGVSYQDNEVILLAHSLTLTNSTYSHTHSSRCFDHLFLFKHKCIQNFD